MTSSGVALAVAEGVPPSGLSTYGSFQSAAVLEPVPLGEEDLLPDSTLGEREAQPGEVGTPLEFQSELKSVELVQPWPTHHLVHGGRSLTRGRSAGVLQLEDGEVRELERKGSVPWATLRLDLPEEFRASADEVASFVYPKGGVPGPVAWAWGYLRALWLQGGAWGKAWGEGLLRGADGELLERGLFWRSLLGLALDLDASQLGREQREACGASTWECVVRIGGELHHMFWRHTCDSDRCQHCSKRRGVKKQGGIASSLEWHESEGRFGFFLTLTFNPSQVMAEYGLSWRAARMVAFRLCSQRLGVFVKRLRRNGIDIEYLARLETHGTGWPHLHPLFVSAELARQVVAEAGCADWAELVSRMAEVRAAHEEAVVCWEAAGRPGRKPVHRCLFPKLRQRLKEYAISAGFGRSMFWVEPVRDTEDVAAYVAKDAFSRRNVVGELTKSRQLAGALIPRSTKAWNPSKGFAYKPPVEEALEEEPERQTEVVVRHHAPIERVRELAEALGGSPGHEVHGADMRGESPGRGGRWPLELQSFLLDAPMGSGLLRFRRGNGQAKAAKSGGRPERGWPVEAVRGSERDVPDEVAAMRPPVPPSRGPPGGKDIEASGCTCDFCRGGGRVIFAWCRCQQGLSGPLCKGAFLTKWAAYAAVKFTS